MEWGELSRDISTPWQLILNSTEMKSKAKRKANLDIGHFTEPWRI